MGELRPAGSTRPAARDGNTWRREASKVGTPLRVMLLCVGSLAAMAPWPLLGIAVSREQFDTSSEGFALFGGITLLPLLLLTLAKVPMGVIYAIIMLVWLAAAVLPDVFLRPRLTTWWAVAGVLGAQSLFSLAQAAVAAMLILGKGA